MKILILSAAPNSSATQSIVNAGKKKGHTMLVMNPANMYLLISDIVNGYDRIYDGTDQLTKPVRLLAKEIDAIIPRIGTNFSYGAAVLEHLNNNLGIFSTQTAIGIKTASDKLISQQKISQAKLRVPRTVLGDRAVHVAWMLEQVGQLPAISKTLTGSQGTGVYPLMDEYQSNVFLENFFQRKENLLLQKFIDGNSKDIRTIVIGGKVVVAMERTAAKGELRANISRGGSGKKIELSTDDKEICIRAARAVGLECAGVDIMKDSEGKTFVIEVNGNYGYHVKDITKTDISTPLIEYCEQNYKAGNKANNDTTAKLFGFLPSPATNTHIKPIPAESEFKTEPKAVDKKLAAHIEFAENFKNALKFSKEMRGL
jgi:ribosomal protein S6--L-glutamate ligase